ncbi:MAG TPA: gluconate 2-dehydrogenase subunit 3 family protein [Puia sp.]|jgi:gluconate 2-dehydrogenase gamma chain|nr:gluconate 2-dehydrogenase subunit 3 family protein [Puia sp.]
MNRRDSLKAIGIATVTTALIDACKPVAKSNTEITTDITGRQPFEAERDKKLQEETFFDAHEMATITVLVDIIIPKDGRSGSATDAKVPEFIEFIVKDEPAHKLPMRGGLKWLDVKCLNQYGIEFKGCTPVQQTEIITAIAYPSLAVPEMQPGVAFFNKIRDLTAIGFFTSKMGIDDLGYKGNTPNQWKGVPPEILKQYGLENV